MSGPSTLTFLQLALPSSEVMVRLGDEWTRKQQKRWQHGGGVVVPLFCTLFSWGQGMDYGLFSINCQDSILPYYIFTTHFGK